jgi:hypothetical protein
VDALRVLELCVHRMGDGTSRHANQNYLPFHHHMDDTKWMR